MENKMLEAALEYRSIGWSVIPLSPMSKIPPKGFEVVPYRDMLATEDEIRGWWDKWPNANIGIITGKLSKLFVVDLDKYKPEYSEEKVLEFFPDSIQTPIDRSPRGGEHLYFNFPCDSGITIHADTLPAVDYRGEGGYVLAPPSVFEGKAGEWIVKPTECQTADAPSAFLGLIKNALKDNIQNIYTHGEDKSCLQTSTESTRLYISGRRDQDLFHVAHLLVKAGCEDDYLYKTLEMLALSCNPPFPPREAEAKIKSAIDRANRKERNLAGDVRDYVLSTSGSFLSTEVAKCLHLSTRDDLKNLSIILKRLEKTEKLIEKSGNKNGCYRTVDQDEEVIDYMSADVAPYEIKMPLAIHEWVNIHPGNVIVVAGESNAGKSAFCLNIAKLNCHANPINYMSSEMQDGAELKIRLMKFGEHLDNWKKVKFTFRTDHYPDKIDPDGLNIIDYLDEGTDAEAYKMPMRIRNIADKLRKGIAVIALQKDPNKGLGFGGSGTMNRSRLYLTMTRAGIIKIEKAKMWRNDNINPNGMFVKFKLVAGSKFSKEGDWGA